MLWRRNMIANTDEFPFKLDVCRPAVLHYLVEHAEFRVFVMDDVAETGGKCSPRDPGRYRRCD